MFSQYHTCQLVYSCPMNALEFVVEYQKLELEETLTL